MTDLEAKIDALIERVAAMEAVMRSIESLATSLQEAVEPTIAEVAKSPVGRMLGMSKPK